MSHVLGSTGAGIPAASCVILGAFFLLGTQVHLVGLAWLGIPIALSYNLWAWRRVKLVPISPDGARAARRAGWLANLFAVLTALFH